MSSSKLLLLREYKELKLRPKSSYFQVYGLVDDNIYEWVVFVIGPPKTFYAGGIYKAIMRFPQTYPMEPPSLQFVCTMYHPNVYSDGKVCISTLQVPAPGSAAANLENSMYWRPVVGVEQALLSVISLLSDPNHEDAANSAAADEWNCYPEEFKRKLKAIKEQSKELVPQDFILPVVVDPPETVRSEDAENEDEQDDEDNDTAFVYPSSDEEEDEEADEDNANCDDVQSNEEAPRSKATSATSEGGLADSEEPCKVSATSVTNSSCLGAKRSQSESEKTVEQSFIKSGVAEVTRTSQKRMKICK